MSKRGIGLFRTQKNETIRDDDERRWLQQAVMRENPREITRSKEGNILTTVERKEWRNKERAWSSGWGDQRDHSTRSTQAASEVYRAEERVSVMEWHLFTITICLSLFVFLLYGWRKKKKKQDFHFTLHVTLFVSKQPREENGHSLLIPLLRELRERLSSWRRELPFLPFHISFSRATLSNTDNRDLFQL